VEFPKGYEVGRMILKSPERSLKGIFAFILVALTVLCTSIMAQEYNADYWLQKGDGFYKNNSYDLALRCYEKAIEINPQDADALHIKGDILKELGRTTEADAAFAKATELGYRGLIPTNITPDEIVVETPTINDSTPTDITPDEIVLETSVINNSTVLLFDASSSMSGNKMNNAKIAVKKFVSGLDSSAEVALIAFYDCSNIKVERPFAIDQSVISSKIDTIKPTGNTPLSAAIDFAKIYIDENANGTRKKIILFTDGEETCPYKATYEGTEDIEVSIIGFDIRKGSPQEKKLLDFTEKIGGNYINADDASTPEALANSLQQAYAGIVLKQNKDYANVWISKGNILYNQGKYGEAVKAYDEAIKIDPKSASAWFNKGLALDELGKYDEVIKAYDQAIKLEPNEAAAWNNKGNALGELGKYSDAIKAYDQAIKIYPNEAIYWSNKGGTLNELGKYSEAINACEKAIKLDPNYANSWRNKGNALNALGRYDDAIECLDKAIRLGSKDDLTLYNRGNDPFTKAKE
jgi:tetratricopeptide (TPR) repeat protein